ncbi:GNAT family N-acetyltransferase [Chromobacterium sp. IIBBL 290-4]|uniref:GNAT family N-acetyltransferase n=1 Tax=Chromobacterium sp. IIBBL 290-4 TaxID=2953890 RepID=UPI0020B68612|nr:GNAT family N-acetyltransferase [Chromobacterium sp. IIBBL 290-4]UTH72428.1 GNAT family N-acetyltransferase [Chromobacterium sp. IIBBL 290-4]
MPHLTTARLLLRRPTLDDIDSLFAIYGDPATNLYNPNGPYPSRLYAAEKMAAWLKGWDQDGIGQWAVAKLDSPAEVIGFGGLSYMDYNGELKLNLGYRFATAAWGKGYASETARAALDCAFERLNAPSIYGKVRPANLASIHVLEKQGFRQIAQLRDVEDRPPSLVFELTQADYLSRA